MGLLGNVCKIAGGAVGTFFGGPIGTMAGTAAGSVVGNLVDGDKKEKKAEAQTTQTTQTTQNSGITSLVNPQTLQLAMSLIGQSGSANNAVDVIKNLGLDSFEANASSTATA